MDAKTLYEQGIAAIRDRKDMAEGRRLLTQSLRLDPTNDMAWLWLSRTVDDPAKAQQCVERALAINPNNPHAQKLHQRYKKATQERKAVEDPATAAILSAAASARGPKVSLSQKRQIEGWLLQAKSALAKDDLPGAVGFWEQVLELDADHPEALPDAVRTLVINEYYDDAKVLIDRAIKAGSQRVAVYMTAIDLAARDSDTKRVNELRALLIQLPTADDALISKIVDDHLQNGNEESARQVLELAMKAHPDSPKLLIQMAKVFERRGWSEQAMQYYNRAAEMGRGSEEGKKADKALQEYRPVITDRERASVGLAWREAAGVAVVFLLMGWQDAGLNLVGMGTRWFGVLVALLGGYLVVTATSSPQQKPLAQMLGGQVPAPGNLPKGEVRGQAIQDPTDLPIIPIGVRIAFGVVGLALLALAFGLVFSHAIELLSNPREPFIPPFDLFFGGS